MPSTSIVARSLAFRPLTPERWPDLEKLFGDRGASAGCWCMFWRLPRSEFNRLSRDGHKKAFRNIVQANEPTGILAYSDDEPIGWCSVAPRETFEALERSRNLRRVDEEPVWSIVCFFVARPFRHGNLMVKLLEAAIEYAKTQGARIVEGYPTEAKGLSHAGTDLYSGVASAFREVGFVAIRRTPRLIMRYFVEEN